MANENAPVVLVTGAAGNLGKTVCERFAATGAQVVRVERTQARVGDTVLAPVDLSSQAATEALVARVVERFGRLDVAVHTVGTYRASGALPALDVEAFTSLFQTNVLTSVLFVRAVSSVMLAQRAGSIVLVSSTAAHHGGQGSAAYSASKAAQLRLVESAAHDFAGTSVTINAVLPGTMDTPQNRAAMPGQDPARWVSLSEVAEVIAYLASPLASGIQGQGIAVSRL